ncbi:MAG: hypothetical protein KGY60_01170 [Bacteroidales bacterium]|nr:hypothetical protein [Bacteroidales bacterium]
MQAIRFSLLCFLVISLGAGCTKEDKATINKAAWSSRDPFNIPLKRRLSEKNEGNKALNPSFERGRFFNDRLNTFELVGWTEVGNATDWTDIRKDEYHTDEAVAGHHAIRITRGKVDEVVEEGAGVLSDFIKVIPGNYSLSYSVRMKDLAPYKERLGTRLGDAVDVRLYYYNKNKIRIDGSTENPQSGRRFDNEFKALPFYGYWNIDSLGWMHARGISHKFPVSDGDLPENTRYVRLFFGLKGSGTMWVDDVDFSYTRRNFSLLERLQPWSGRPFNPYELVIPQPKKIQPGRDYALFGSTDSQSAPAIVIPDEAPQVIRRAANLLQEKLLAVKDGSQIGRPVDIPILKGIAPQEMQSASVVFSLGKTILNQKHYDSLPYNGLDDHPQAYFVHAPRKDGNVICIDGNRQVGIYYGVSTLIQLFDEGKGSYYHADILDYPDTDRRGVYSRYSLKGPEGLDFLTRYKFNRIHLRIAEPGSDTLHRHIRQMGKASIKGELFGAGLSVRPHRAYGSPEENLSMSREQEQNLHELVLFAQKNHFRRVVLRMDQILAGTGKGNCVLKNRPNASYAHYRNLLDIHSQLIREIAQRTNDEVEVGYMPIWHNTQCILRSHGRGELFLKELFRKVPPEVEFLWSGSVAHPLIVDPSELHYIRKSIGKDPVFFSLDIHPYSRQEFLRAYPGKARMSSLFGHFSLELPGNLFLGEGKGFYADLDPGSALDRISLRTLAACMWNASACDPDRTLIRVLTSLYGHQTAIKLVRLNEAYYGLYEMYGKIRSKETKAKYVRSAENFKRQVDTLMSSLGKNLQDSDIWKDLTGFQIKAHSHFDSIMSR